MSDHPAPQPSTAEALQAERGMAFLEGLADQWAAEIDLTSIIKNAASPMDLNRSAPNDVRAKFKGRMEAQIDAIARQAFLEGALRGIYGLKDYQEEKARTTPAPPTAEAIREAVEALRTFVSFTASVWYDEANCVEEEREAMDAARAALARLEADAEAARAVIKALRFYANPANYVTAVWEDDQTTPHAVPVTREEGRPCDCGDTARAALARLEASQEGGR